MFSPSSCRGPSAATQHKTDGPLRFLCLFVCLCVCACVILHLSVCYGRLELATGSGKPSVSCMPKFCSERLLGLLQKQP